MFIIYMDLYILSLYIYVSMYLFICYVKTDRKIFLYYYFGVNVPRWCSFVHLFDNPFQNSPYGHEKHINILASIILI